MQVEVKILLVGLLLLIVYQAMVGLSSEGKAKVEDKPLPQGSEELSLSNVEVTDVKLVRDSISRGQHPMQFITFENKGTRYTVETSVEEQGTVLEGDIIDISFHYSKEYNTTGNGTVFVKYGELNKNQIKIKIVREEAEQKELHLNNDKLVKGA